MNEVNEKTKLIAELLASYEIDEPHWDEPLDKTYLPATSWSEIELELSTPHFGDCTGECAPCIRCWMEHIVHKARWISERLPDL